jgi:hypothetical protein
LLAVRHAAALQIRLLDLNVLRWRYGRNALGEEMIESNARFVRWSDGSLQLQVGSETLDVSQQDVARDQSHLFVRHPGAGIIQAQAHMRSKLVFRPSSLQSKSHKLLTAAIDKRHQRVIKVKKVVTSVDPDAEKTEREKAEQRRAKDSETLARKQGAVAHRYGLDSRRGGLLSRDFLEGDDGAARASMPLHARRMARWHRALVCCTARVLLLTDPCMSHDPPLTRAAYTCCLHGAVDGEEDGGVEPWTGTADARAALSRGGGSGSGAAAAAAAERAKAKRKRAGRAVLEDSDEDGSGEESWSEEDDKPKRAKAKGRKRLAGGSDESE